MLQPKRIGVLSALYGVHNDGILRLLDLTCYVPPFLFNCTKNVHVCTQESKINRLCLSSIALILKDISISLIETLKPIYIIKVND